MEKTITIEKCNHCGQAHNYILDVEKQVPVFGGPVRGPSNGFETELGFACPVTNLVFSHKVNLEKGLKIKGVLEKSECAEEGLKPAEDAAIKSEFQTWANDSRNRGLSYSTAMLTTSTGAIGVYFAIEKYLGMEKLTADTKSLFPFLPPVFYLAASLCFVVALKPRLGKITLSEFEKFRLSRLEKINTWNTIGLISFLAGNITGVFHFISLIK